MKFNVAMGLIVATPLLLSACSPQDVAETISTAQVCTEAAGIFIEIQEILVLASEDPTALETHRIALNRPGFSSVFYTRMELCQDSIRKSSENAPSAW